MKPKKPIIRTCVVSHEKCEKKDLLRIVKTKDQQIKIDETGKMNGKGAYIKKDKELLKIAKKNKALDKALDITIPEEIYDKIEQLI